MKIFAQPGIYPRRSIPNERVEIVAHGMESVIPGYRLHRAPDVAERGVDVFFLKPATRERFVVVGPRRIERFLTPRRLLTDDYLRHELIEAEHALPLRMMAQKQNEIMQQRAHRAVLVELEIVSPAVS